MWILNAKKASNVSLGENIKAGINQFSIMKKLKNRDIRVRTCIHDFRF